MIVSLPAPPLTVIAAAAENAVAVTPDRSIAFAPGPPVTAIDVIAAQFAAPLPGSAPLTCT